MYICEAKRTRKFFLVMFGINLMNLLLQLGVFVCLNSGLHLSVNSCGRTLKLNSSTDFIILVVICFTYLLFITRYTRVRPLLVKTIWSFHLLVYF